MSGVRRGDKGGGKRGGRRVHTIVERGDAKKQIEKKLQMIPSWVNRAALSLTRKE